MSRSLLDKVVRLCETRGFSIESCVEGSLGTAYTYHFGPLGTELRRNLRNAWWYDVVRSKANVYGFETNGGMIHALNSQHSAFPVLSGKGNGSGQENISEISDESSILGERSWTSEDTNIAFLVKFNTGIKIPFGAAMNRKYFWKPENDKYIFRYVIFSCF